MTHESLSKLKDRYHRWVATNSRRMSSLPFWCAVRFYTSRGGFQHLRPGLALESFMVFRNHRDEIFLTSGFGAMGYGLPAAIGACFATTSHVCRWEGGLQLNLGSRPSHQSITHYIVVINNGVIAQSKYRTNCFSGDCGSWASIKTLST